MKKNPSRFFELWRMWKSGGRKTNRVPGPHADEHAAHYEKLGSTVDDTAEMAVRRDLIRHQLAEADLNPPPLDAMGPLVREISPHEIERAIAKVGNRKTAVGPDKVSWETISSTPLEVLREIVVDCIDQCDVPNEWKLSTVIPIPKPTTIANDVSTYRGITLESCGLKLLTTIITPRLEEWGNYSGVLPPEQNGYRTGYKTENSPFILHCVLDRARFDKTDIYVAFVDLEKAFDSVYRFLLWLLMMRYGANGPILKLVRHIYAQMQSQVKTAGATSHTYRTEMGVLQGDPMSGILWIIFIAALGDALYSTDRSPDIGGRIVRLLLMADNIALLAYTREELETLLASLQNFCDENLVKISVKKSVMVAFLNSKASEDQAVPVLLNGVELTEEQWAKYIGIIFDSKNPLQYERHIQKRATSANQKAIAILRTIDLSAHRISVSEALQLYKTEVLSRMLFGSELTITCGDTSSFHKVEITFLRRLLRISDTSTVEGIYLELDMLPVRVKRLEKAISFYLYASSSDAPELVRLATWDAVHLPPRVRASNRSWFHALCAELREYDLGPPAMPGPGGIDWNEHDSDVTLVASGMITELRERARDKMIASLASKEKFTILNALPPSSLQKYLAVLPPRQREHMTRLRLSEHHLAIERGRHTVPYTPPEQRTCRLCGTHQIESEIHVLAECEGNGVINSSRAWLMDKLLGIKPEILGIEHTRADVRSLAFWSLLWNSQQEEVIKALGPFVSKCFEQVKALGPYQ